MALTKTPIELSSTPGIVDNSNATAITIDSSENVGIGCSPSAWIDQSTALEIGPSMALEDYSVGGANVSAIYNNAYRNASNVSVYKETDFASNYAQYNGEHSFNIAASGTAGATITWTPAMRITSSGNVLVGTTNSGLSSSSSNTGINLIPNGASAFVRDGGAVLYLNRVTSDGSIVQFRKDGSTVGSIGTSGGDLLVGTGNTGLLFFDATPQIIPRNTDGGNVDGDVDLGASGSRFKDLYLSGGVYLGGTGAANKLDDYEEGTWTPDLKFGGGVVGIVYSNRAAKYTKIGNRVYFDVYISLSSAGTSTGAGTISLPIAPSDDFSTSGHEASCSIGFATGLNNIVRAGIFGDKIVFFDQNSTQSGGEHENEFANNCNFRVSGNYQTA